MYVVYVCCANVLHYMLYDLCLPKCYYAASWVIWVLSVLSSVPVWLYLIMYRLCLYLAQSIETIVLTAV